VAQRSKRLQAEVYSAQHSRRIQVHSVLRHNNQAPARVCLVSPNSRIPEQGASLGSLRYRPTQASVYLARLNNRISKHNSRRISATVCLEPRYSRRRR
jgi:hypothetical protein